MCPILTDVGARAEAGEQLSSHAIIQVRQCWLSKDISSGGGGSEWTVNIL